ncbi:uncharacterized protein LOC105027626 [Esox lucius]|uniref:uncharacterized protein LOC105027626 n=1 Tax=Esox lucius TaxID=8010 RepID=UPI0005779643|nr:uncharacterized protein LOC105027626 [Esox lucius]
MLSEDLPWIPATYDILTRSSGYISGIVKSTEELDILLENHKRATCSAFIKWSDHIKDASKRRLLWQVEDYAEDVPLYVVKRVTLACQHGKAPNRRLSTATEHSSENGSCKKRLRKRLKKLGCPAKLFIRHVTRYDTFSVKGDASRAKKEDAMKRLKQALTQTNPPTSTFIHVKLPLVEAHHNHSIDSGCCHSRPMHPRVKEKIQEFVGAGLTSVACVKIALKQFVLTELCSDDLCKPHEEDQAYFPSSKTIHNHIKGIGAGNGHRKEVKQYVVDDGPKSKWEEDIMEDEAVPEVENEHGRDVEEDRLQSVRAAQLALREELKKFTDASFLCEHLDTLESSTEALMNLRTSFLTHCRNENPLVLSKHKVVGLGTSTVKKSQSKNQSTLKEAEVCDPLLSLNAPKPFSDG